MSKNIKKVLSYLLIFVLCVSSLLLTSNTSEAAIKKATSITLNTTSKTLTIGQLYQLKVKKTKPTNASKSITWKSNNNKVAKVTNNGRVLAKKVGKATITAQCKNNKKVKATCKITVYSKVSSIKVNFDTKEIKVGNMFQLKASVYPKTANQKVTYSSSNKEVAVVSKSGRVVGKKVGKATITIASTTNKKKKVKCLVVVAPKDNGTTAETPEIILKTGITRAEWINALLQAMECQTDESNLEKDEKGNTKYHFSDIKNNAYATAIETAFSYGYITVDNNINTFQPDIQVTREYAVMTAVNALGVSLSEEISCTDSKDIMYKTQACYAVAEQMVSLENGKFYPDRVLTKNEQTTILNRLSEIRKDRSGENIKSPVVEYAEDVIVIEQESSEGYTLSELSKGCYQVNISEHSLVAYGLEKDKLVKNEILVLPATEDVPSGITLSISETEESNDTIKIKGTVPSDIAMVYEHIAVSGTADAASQTINPEKGVTIEKINGVNQFVISKKALNANLNGSLGELYKKEVAFKPNDDVSGSITFKIPDVSYCVDADLSLHSGIKVNQISLTVKENIKIETNIKGSIEGSIPVGETSIPIKEIPGLAIKAKITLEYSASGKVKFVLNMNAQQTVGIKDGVLFKEAPKPSVTQTLTIEAEAKVGPKVTVSLVWPSFVKEPIVIFDATTDLGLGIKGSSVTHTGNEDEDYLHCLDGKLYFYLNAALITEDCILHKLNLHKDWEIFNDSNSPLRWHGHWENGTKVEQCTWEESAKATEKPEVTKTPVGVEKDLEYRELEDGTIEITGCNKDVIEVNIPDEIEGKTVSCIGGGAFLNCNNLKSVRIPESVIFIGDVAFSGCNSLTSINIPKGVTIIGDGAFEYCGSLISINIPEGVTGISCGAFSGCDSLVSVSFLEGELIIDSYAFSDCSSLTSVNIPEGVTYIGMEAFSECNNLKNIYYAGTEEQWKAIEKGTDWDKGTSESLTIHYESTKLPVTNNVGVKDIVQNDYTSAAIMEDNSLWMWGKNAYGELGNGNYEDSATPLHIMDNVKKIQFDWGETYALKHNKELYYWGESVGNTPQLLMTDVQNFQGRFGMVYYIKENKLYGYKASDHGTYYICDDAIETYYGGSNNKECVLKKNHSLYQYETLYTKESNSDMYVLSKKMEKILENVDYVLSDWKGCMALKKDGTLWTWGNENEYGQLGNGTTESVDSPVKILENVKKIFMSDDVFMAIKEDNSLWAWGDIEKYKFEYDAKNTLAPVCISQDVKTVEFSEENFSARCLVIKLDNSIWYYGEYAYAPSDTGVMIESHYNKQLFGDILEKNKNFESKSIKAISSGWHSFAILLEDNSVWTFGHNKYGQLGNGTFDFSTEPKMIFGPSVF